MMAEVCQRYQYNEGASAVGNEDALFHTWKQLSKQRVKSDVAGNCNP